MNHRFRFSTSGNSTKHMPIGYLPLWVQPRSVTSGDLSWPWNSSGAMSRVTPSPCIDTNLINYPHSSQSHHAKLCLLTISLKSCRRLLVLWRHNFVTWPDPTNFLHQKLRKRCPISYGKFQHDSQNGVAPSSEKLMGVASTPLTGWGLKHVSHGFRTKSRMIKGKRMLGKVALSQKSKVKSTKSRRVKGRHGKKSTLKKPKKSIDKKSKWQKVNGKEVKMEKSWWWKSRIG